MLEDWRTVAGQPCSWLMHLIDFVRSLLSGSKDSCHNRFACHPILPGMLHGHLTDELGNNLLCYVVLVNVVRIAVIPAVLSRVMVLRYIPMSVGRHRNF